MSQWIFFHDLFGQWHWRRQGADEASSEESERGFNTRVQCVADAILHGYPKDPGNGAPPSRTDGQLLARLC